MSDGEPEFVFYRVRGSTVYHNDEKCHHLGNSTDVETLTEEPDFGRECRQCWYNGLSYEEKEKRKRRGRRKRSMTVRYRW